MLKDIVDETSFGKYDFMYLRIGTYPIKPQFIRAKRHVEDFANNCK